MTNVQQGQIVMCLYEQMACRGRVESLREGKVELFYIDFGNREEVAISKLLAIPEVLAQMPVLVR